MKIIKCNLCRKTKFDFLYTTRDRMYDLDGDFKLYTCRNCSIAFLNPQPNQKQLIKHYPSKKYYAYNANKNPGILTKIREYLIDHYYSPTLISRLISTFIKKVPAIPEYKRNGKILDLGCGTGETLILLKKLGWDVYGMDMDKRALDVCRKKGLKNIKLGTYKDLNKYPDNFFDAIRLFHVIEHLDDPMSAVRLIKKKLKRDGELILGTPNIYSIAGKVFKYNWYNLDSPRHLFLFSPKTLRFLVEENGFKVNAEEFCSAGGLLGSVQYFIESKFKKKTNLVKKSYLIILFYPFDWFLDKIKQGDVISLSARK